MKIRGKGITRRSFLTSSLPLMLSLPAVYGKQNARPLFSLSSEQAAVVEKAIAREKVTFKEIQKRSPVIQAYIQNMRPDEVPQSDQYFLGRVDFAKSIVDTSHVREGSGHSLFRGSMKYISGLTKALKMEYVPAGFMGMIFLDPIFFDRGHYDFGYVRRDFLGAVRVLVFDVHPKPGSRIGLFTGRLWIEDQNGNIVRFNGTYPSDNDREDRPTSLHFDSWRENVQPDLWLPVGVYAQEVLHERDVSFKAQTYVWGYNLKLPIKGQNNTPLKANANADQSSENRDVSTQRAQQEWNPQAEKNALERLVQAGLLGAPSDFDKTLETVTNRIVIDNAVHLDNDVRCRVMLTTPLESVAIGNTIILSKGLIDVLPSDAGLAAFLSFQLAHIILGHHIDIRYAFDDRLLFPANSTFERIRFSHTGPENEVAAGKAIELLNNSVYNSKLAEPSIFLATLNQHSKQLQALTTPILGDSLLQPNGEPWLKELMVNVPTLNTNRLDQITALPLGSRLKVDPWDDRVIPLEFHATPNLNATDKRPFEATPIHPLLAFYAGPTAGYSGPKYQQGSLPPAVVPAFPWPPPQASARYIIPDEIILSKYHHLSLGDVNRIFVEALSNNGYSDLGYFRCPGTGFVLVTRLEHIKDDGTPMPAPSRWSFKEPLSIGDFRVADYLRALLAAPHGYYRIIAFVVTDLLFSESSRPVSELAATAWFQDGLNDLPTFISRKKYEGGMKSTALIYEFEITADTEPSRPVQKVPSHLDAKTHLVKSGLWASLGGK
jgi:hypothetical protein